MRNPSHFQSCRNGLFTTFLLLSLPAVSIAQQLTFDLPKSKYGLPVVNDVAIYKKIVAADPDNELVDMRAILPDAQFDVTYAHTNNFLKRKLVPHSRRIHAKTSCTRHSAGT
jgi:D-alanyl-D-alanine dipeptidase